MKISRANTSPARLSRSQRANWLRRKRQLIRLLNALTSPPDRIRAEKIKQRVLVPILKLCQRSAGHYAYPSALQWHAKSAGQSLDRIGYYNTKAPRTEFETLRTHLHACVTMIDGMLKAREPASAESFFSKLVSGRPHYAPYPARY